MNAFYQILASASGDFHHKVIKTNFHIGVSIKEIMRLAVANNLVDINVHTAIVCPKEPTIQPYILNGPTVSYQLFVL